MSSRPWRAVVPTNNTKYVLIDNVGRLLHRELLGAPAGVQVDHVNLDRLDNRRENLRLATPSQNQWNRPKQRNNTTGFKGVYYDKRSGKYQAQIGHNNRKVHLGYFHTAEGAHAAYCKAAHQLHGEFARVA